MQIDKWYQHFSSTLSHLLSGDESLDNVKILKLLNSQFISMNQSMTVEPKTNRSEGISLEEWLK